MNECRDSTGKVLTENGNGTWIKFIDDGFKNYVEGNVVNGLEDGEWRGKKDDTLDIVWKYEKGSLVSSKTFDKHGKEIYVPIFTSVEQVPEFPGGLEAFGRFIEKNLRYPRQARENGTQGRVIVTFVVERDGSVTNIKVARGIGDGCDEEALRIINLFPKWKPGIQDGHACTRSL